MFIPHMRLQFSLRTVFVVIAILAIPLTWLSWRLHRAEHQRHAVSALGSWNIAYDFEMDPRRPGSVLPEIAEVMLRSQGSQTTFSNRIAPVRSKYPGWLVDLLGIDFFMQVTYVYLDLNRAPPDIRQVLSLLDGVESVTVVKSQGLVDDDIAFVDVCKSLRSVNIACSIEPQSASRLAHLDHLESLTVMSELDSESFKWLMRIPNLRELRCIGNETLTDSVMRHIQDAKALRSLILTSDCLTDACMLHLRTLHNLRELTISMPLLTDEGLMHLSDRNGITKLSLYSTSVSGKGIRSLRNIGTLSELSLSIRNHQAPAKHIADSADVFDYAALLQLQHLTRLYLEGYRIRPEDVLSFKALPHLKYIWIDSPELTSADVIEIRKRCPQLKIETPFLLLEVK